MTRARNIDVASRRLWSVAVAAVTALMVGGLDAIALTPAGASGDPTLDRYIIVPVSALPQVAIPAATLAPITQEENSYVEGVGAHVHMRRWPDA